MVEIYILVENQSLSFGGVPHSSHAGVFHNWRILRKYCCPGSDRYRKQTKHTKEKSLWKKQKLSLHQKNTCESVCSSLLQLCIATSLGATSMFMDIILFHPDNIIEFLAYMVKLVVVFFFQCIESTFIALKNHVIEVLQWLLFGGFNNLRCSPVVGIHNQFMYLGAKILFGGLIPCSVVTNDGSTSTSPKGEILISIFFNNIIY